MAGLILSTWKKVTSPPELLPHSIHLWRFPLDDDGLLPDILSSEERVRAQRLRIPAKANEFVVGRTRLRQVLGLYLDIPPEELTFTYNEHGKPSLEKQHFRNFSFNLSHSGGWGVCAVRRGGDVGIDVELVMQELAVVPLAERFFSPTERDWLLALKGNRQRRNFYRLWTRKEAWLKGKGGGFSEVHLGLDSAHISPRISVAEGWTLMNLRVARGTVAALAVAGEIKKVERFTFSG